MKPLSIAVAVVLTVLMQSPALAGGYGAQYSPAPHDFGVADQGPRPTTGPYRFGWGGYGASVAPGDGVSIQTPPVGVGVGQWSGVNVRAPGVRVIVNPRTGVKVNAWGVGVRVSPWGGVGVRVDP
jgi:hypothetical protein